MTKSHAIAGAPGRNGLDEARLRRADRELRQPPSWDGDAWVAYRRRLGLPALDHSGDDD